MARPKAPRPTSASFGSMAALAASARAYAQAEVVSGNEGALAGSAAIFRPGRRANPKTDRNSIAKVWQMEAYRHVNICGEARYAATLFAAMAGRAEIGVSKANALARKAVWVTEGPAVDAFAELAPTVRERSRLIRDYMIHYVIAGECYLIARKRVDTDPGYEMPPENPATGKPWDSWDEYLTDLMGTIDPLDEDAVENAPRDPNVDNPIWEIVSVMEIQKVGDTWSVRHDNGNYLTLSDDDPVIRMWNPDPEDRREAWSPFRSLLPTLREIEFLTKHIFTQVRSRLMSAGVWFVPENMTFAPPPSDAVEGGEEAIAQMNEAEQFMMSLAASSMELLYDDEVAFPSVVMASPDALTAIDQSKLIQFWSEIDDKAMTLRSDAVRRFSLGMDLPPEQVLGSSGLAVTGAGGSAGSVNHWGVWANEEQTISAHIEPALDNFTGTLTVAYLRVAVPDTDEVIAYDTATLRLRQDRSKEAIELYDRGLLKGDVTVREVGFDPQNDMMDEKEHKIWLLNKIVSGTFAPDQMAVAFQILTGEALPVSDTSGGETKGLPGRNQPRSLEDHPYEGPPRVQNDQTEAPFKVLVASCEVLVLRALEKTGHRILNDGKRGKDRDRETPAHLAYVTASASPDLGPADFDLSLAHTVLSDLPAKDMERAIRLMRLFCHSLYTEKVPYSREALTASLSAVL